MSESTTWASDARSACDEFGPVLMLELAMLAAWFVKFDSVVNDE